MADYCAISVILQYQDIDLHANNNNYECSSRVSFKGVPKIEWNNIKCNLFRNAADEALTAIDVLICYNYVTKCYDSAHRVQLSKFSNALTRRLINVTLVGISHSGKAHKLAWSDELYELQSASLKSHHVWVNVRKPHCGQININRLTCKAKYKQAIRGAHITS